MNTAPFLSRHLGDYLLVAQLSEDPIGTVFRALYAADERRFVRLRVLQSDELSGEAVQWAIRENRLRDATLAHDAIVVHPELDVVDGIAFMTWDETAGWTLDTMLARVRALGIRIPIEYGLLIAERIAAALEHAHQTVAGGRPADHGLLWPGFVSISHDSSVRVGGFGIAEGVLPSLNGLRMQAEIAPYVAPETRQRGKISTNADVYSLGAILVELVTGRRPSLDTTSAELRAGDPRSDELGAFLRRCLAPSEERFGSAVDAHRALQQMVTGNPFSLFTANLALFLYKLLNPEGQSVAPSSDWESTNPVVVEARTRRQAVEPDSAPAPEAPKAPRRRRGDLDPVEAESSESPSESSAAPAALPADFLPAPAPVLRHAAALLAGRPSPRGSKLSAFWWRLPAAALAAAAGVAVAVFFVASRVRSGSVAATGRSGAATFAPALHEASPAAFRELVLETPSRAGALTTPRPAGRFEPAANRPVAAARPGKKVRPELKQPAEDLRLRAALARIEADRLNAHERAAGLFGEGRQSEEAGERFLRQRDYDAAQLAFSLAARLFEQAQEATWEERVRETNLSASMP